MSGFDYDDDVGGEQHLEVALFSLSIKCFFQVFGSKGEIWRGAEKVNSKRKYLRHFEFNLKIVVWERGQIFELHRTLHLHSLIFSFEEKVYKSHFSSIFVGTEKFSWVEYCCTKLQHTWECGRYSIYSCDKLSDNLSWNNNKL